MKMISVQREVDTKIESRAWNATGSTLEYEFKWECITPFFKVEFHSSVIPNIKQDVLEQLND